MNIPNRSLQPMPRNLEPRVARFLSEQRVARLATADASGAPHVVPICFVCDGAHLYSALDLKPKRVPDRRLKRVRNILQNPKVAIVADRYSEDWNELAYVLIHGEAAILENEAERRRAEHRLREKYPQYRELLREGCTILKITPTRVVSWGRL